MVRPQTAAATSAEDQARGHELEQIEEIQDFLPLEDDPVLLSEQFPDERWLSLKFRKRKFLILVVSLMLAFTPLVMKAPVSVDMTYDAICRNMDIPADQCYQSPEANKKIADLTSASNLVSTIPTIVMIPVMTAFAESWGYMAGIVLVLMTLTVESSILYPLVYVCPAHWSIYRLLVTNVLDSLVGGIYLLTNLTVLVTAQLFPNPKLRPRYLGYLKACVAIPTSFGPLIGGFLTQYMKTRDFFILTTILHVISIIVFIRFVEFPRFILSATAQEEIAQSREATPLEPENGRTKGSKIRGYLREQALSLRVFRFKHIRSPAVRLTAIIFVICRVFTEIDPDTVIVIYAKQFFNWDKAVLGTVITSLAVMQLAWSIVGFPILQHFILKYWPANAAGADMVDKICLLIGIMAQSIGFFFMSIATTSGQFIASFLLSTNSFLAVLIIKPTILKFVPPSEAAALVTALSLIDAVATKLFPSFVTWIYGRTISWWPTFEFQMEFWIAGFLTIIILFFVTTNPHLHLPSET